MFRDYDLYLMTWQSIALLKMHKIFGGCWGSNTPPQVGHVENKVWCSGKQLFQGLVKGIINALATRVQAEELIVVIRSH